MLSHPLVCLTALAAGLAFADTVHAFTLTSPDFARGGPIAKEQAFDSWGCTGGNVSPALKWSGAPAGTKSFALLVHDPDAPTGGAGWWHWVMVNIPAGTRELAKDAGKTDGSRLPAGAASVDSDYGLPGYGGPCPPAGDKPHHYHFTLYALKVEKLDLPKGATASLTGFMVNANAIGKAALIGTYGRPK